MADRELLEFLSGYMTDERRETFERVIANRTRYISVVLEDIYQPHNASAVLRSCDSFGIQDIHVIEKRNRYRVSRDVALGSDKWLTLTRHTGKTATTTSVCNQLRDKGYRIVATTPHESGVDVEDFDLEKGKVALLFGTELEGLTREAVECADEFLRIPMYGFTGSLNISVSAAIILHYLTGKLRSGNIDWKLEEEELTDLKLEWLHKSIKSAALLEKQFYTSRKVK